MKTLRPWPPTASRPPPTASRLAIRNSQFAIRHSPPPLQTLASVKELDFAWSALIAAGIANCFAAFKANENKKLMVGARSL